MKTKIAVKNYNLFRLFKVFKCSHNQISQNQHYVNLNNLRKHCFWLIKVDVAQALKGSTPLYYGLE